MKIEGRAIRQTGTKASDYYIRIEKFGRVDHIRCLSISCEE